MPTFSQKKAAYPGQGNSPLYEGEKGGELMSTRTMVGGEKRRTNEKENESDRMHREGLSGVR